MDKTNPADARSDFDLDGLTALQEYELSLAHSGYGKPLGQWTMEAIPRPTGFTTATPSVTLIETAGNGTLVARVQGKLIGSTVTTSYPYTWSAATGWARVAEPTGFPPDTIASLTPLDVNSSGQVVGYFNSGGTKGFLHTPNANGIGGQTSVFYLNPGPGQTLAIPRRISDAGYLVGDENALGGRSVADTTNGDEITFPGLLTSPRYHDVNEFGEFIGSVYNPLVAGTEIFLAMADGHMFLTGIESAPPLEQELWDNAAAAWYFDPALIPDIDPDSITWSSYPSGYAGLRAGTAIDRTTGGSINVNEGSGVEFYWLPNNAYSSDYWYSYPGFSPSVGAVNDWGEFAGNYSGSMKRTTFQFYEGAPGVTYAYENYYEGVFTNGICFYDGSYHFSKSRPAIYSVSNDPRVLIGTPFAIWSGSQVVPITSLIPAGNPTAFTSARLADNGQVVLQGSPTTQIYILKPNQDADGDGMPDDWEKYYGLNPNEAADRNEDYDGDGVSNWAEFRYRTHPAEAAVSGSTGQFIDLRPGIDTDGDGMPNVWEWKHGLDYNNAADALADRDGDGLTNLQEFLLGTDVGQEDSDYDGIPDGWEIANKLNPSHHNDGGEDHDGDGLTNFREFIEGRNPKAHDLLPLLEVEKTSVSSNVEQSGSEEGTQWTGNWSDGSPAAQHQAHETFQQVVQQLNQKSYANQWHVRHRTGQEIPGDRLIWLHLDGRQPSSGSSGVLYPENSSTFSSSYHHASKYQLRIARNGGSGAEMTQHYLLLRYPNLDMEQTPSAETLEFTLPESQPYSDPVEVVSDQTNSPALGVVPMDSAPDVLPVNSDFDEGRIDPATGYAMPDCDDPDIALEAARNHLDGKYAANVRITEDMHSGWFGLNPDVAGNSFWDGAEVTIRKLDKEDPDTPGHKESGHVRFYAKWGEGPSQYRAILPYDFETLGTVNLVEGGVNRDPGKSVYGPASAIPSGARYFMEGVHPGKITLEWRYKKGSLDVRYEQAFEVVTHKTAPEWKRDLAYKIRLETSNDPSGQINVEVINFPVESYRTRMERVSEYYDYYQDCFVSPLRSKPIHSQAINWPGLARLAGSQVIAGLSDAEYARLLLQARETASIPTFILPPAIENQLVTWSLGEVETLQQALFTGGRDIFKSIGWQMHAYRSSGYRALDWVDTETGEPEARAMVAADVWKNLRMGVLNHDKVILDRSSLDITDREQNVTIVPTWGVISSLGVGIVDWIFSVRATNSCTPSGGDFRVMFPGKQLSNTGDRWNWIKPTTLDGVMDAWNKHPEPDRETLVRRALEQDARRFSLISHFPHALPTPVVALPVWVWDDEDVP